MTFERFLGYAHYQLLCEFQMVLYVIQFAHSTGTWYSIGVGRRSRTLAPQLACSGGNAPTIYIIYPDPMYVSFHTSSDAKQSASSTDLPLHPLAQKAMFVFTLRTFVLHGLVWNPY